MVSLKPITSRVHSNPALGVVGAAVDVQWTPSQRSPTAARPGPRRPLSNSCERAWTNELPRHGDGKRSAFRYDPQIMQSVYEAAGGDAGMLRLAHAWHARVMADHVVSHAFSHGFHPDHGERLAAYWAEALGGPTRYSAVYGDESSVVRIHSGDGPHEEMDRRAIACFDQALADVGLADDRVRQVLHDYFAWATLTTMSEYHRSEDDVPRDLRIPQWSWDGLVGITGPDNS